MKRTTATREREVDVSRRPGPAWAVAALVLVAALGCNKAKRTYPTISSRNPDGGGVSVKGTYNHCPQNFFVASPDHVRVGQPITLTAAATDVDGDVLTYAWMASPSGTIENPHSPTAVFQCTTRGSVVITLTVADDSCDVPASGEVLCQSEDGGAPDGAAGAGGATGAGGMGGSITGQPGTAGSTGASGGTTGAAGSTISGAAGSVGSGGVTGSAGAGNTGSGTGGSGTGGTVCIETAPPAQIATACADCITANYNPANDGCCKIKDAMGLQLCQAAAACMRAGGPPVGACNMAGDLQTCFCGTHVSTCDQAGQPNGPCVSAYTAAAARNITTMTTDAPSAAQVLARQGDPNYAIGRAANVSSVAGTFCPTECEIGQ